MGLPAAGGGVQNGNSIEADKLNWFGEMAEWLKALVC
jgi:hypothetical protein